MHQFFDNKMLRYQHAALVLITLLNNLCKPHFSFPIFIEWLYYSQIRRHNDKCYYLIKQEGQMALDRSPKYCLKLLYRYLLKADNFPCDTWGGHFWTKGHNLNKLGRLEVH